MEERKRESEKEDEEEEEEEEEDKDEEEEIVVGSPIDVVRHFAMSKEDFPQVGSQEQ